MFGKFSAKPLTNIECTALATTIAALRELGMGHLVTKCELHDPRDSMGPGERLVLCRVVGSTDKIPNFSSMVQLLVQNPGYLESELDLSKDVLVAMYRPTADQEAYERCEVTIGYDAENGHAPRGRATKWRPTTEEERFDY